MTEKEKEVGYSSDDWFKAYNLIQNRHINDDRLLAERLSLFLVASSFLFIGFVTLLQLNDACLLTIVVPIIGLALCFLVLVAAWRTKRGLDFWDAVERKIENENAAFEAVRQQKVKINCHEYQITPSSVYEYIKHDNLGKLIGGLRTRLLYTYMLPSLFIILWLTSLIWVILYY